MNIGEKKEFIGYVGEYSDTWLFETDKTPYSSIVVLAMIFLSAVIKVWHIANENPVKSIKSE